MDKLSYQTSYFKFELLKDLDLVKKDHPDIQKLRKIILENFYEKIDSNYHFAQILNNLSLELNFRDPLPDYQLIESKCLKALNTRII